MTRARTWRGAEDARRESCRRDRGQGSRRRPGRLRPRETSACNRAATTRPAASPTRRRPAARWPLGGPFDGHETAGRHPSDDEEVRDRARGGSGLMGVAKDIYPHDGDTYSFVVGFAEVGSRRRDRQRRRLVDYLAVGERRHGDQPAQLARSAARRHQPRHRPRAPAENGVYDQQYGVPLAKRFLPQQAAHDSGYPGCRCRRSRSTSPNPETPTGARGRRRARRSGAGYGSVMNAIANAVGEGTCFSSRRRSPADIVLTSLEAGQADARSADHHTCKI